MKPVVLAPMPSAITTIAAAENQRLLRDQPEGESQILHDAFEHGEPAHLAVLLLQ